MPSYWPIRRMSDQAMRERTIDRLLALRAKLSAEVTVNKSPDSFLLATWNLREFDRGEPRLEESLFYIAEIIAAFDLVAIQEVNRDLSGLRRLMRLLGDDWDYIVTDATEGDPGNDERLACVFDKRKIKFRNIVGEIVLPPEGGKPAIQFARTPFMISFQAGWFKFNLCTVHILFGTGDEGMRRRVEEIEAISRFFKKRQDKDGLTYILLGDFNILNPEDATFHALRVGGFRVPEDLMDVRSNLGRTQHYDQIAFKEKKRIIECHRAGVFNWDEVVFRNEEEHPDAYRRLMSQKHQDKTSKKLKSYYRTHWRTREISDHLPIWVQIKTDFTDDYLKSLKQGKQPLATLTNERGGTKRPVA